MSHTIPLWAAEWLLSSLQNRGGSWRWAGGGRHCAVPQLAEPDEGDKPFCRAARAHQRLILRSGTRESDPNSAPKWLPKWPPKPLRGPTRDADQTPDLVFHCRGGGI